MAQLPSLRIHSGQGAWQPCILTAFLSVFCRIIFVSFLLLGAVALFVTSLVLLKDVYGSHSKVIAPQDQHPISVSTYFCDAVQLEDLSVDQFLYLYVFAQPPPLTVWQAFNITLRHTSIPDGKYKYWSYYMNKGSQVNVSVCANPEIYFYVLKGESNFDKWKNGDSYSSIFLDYYSGNCVNGRNGDVSLKMNSADDYYFVFEASDVRADLDVTLSFNRSMYNLSALPSDSCHANPKCSQSLSYASNQFVLIVANNSFQTDDNVNVRWSFSARSWFYGTAFGIPSITLVVIAILAGMYFCFGRPKHCLNCYGTHQNERVGLIGSNPSEAGKENIVRTTIVSNSNNGIDNEPPSYNVATAMY